jgi:uncharacterized protein DUF6875
LSPGRRADPAGSCAHYYPAWVDNPADDVTMEDNPVLRSLGKGVPSISWPLDSLTPQEYRSSCGVSCELKERVMPARTTPAQTTNLFLLEDLEDVSKTSELPESDLDALRSIAGWIRTYVVKPHRALIGRAGPVCPYLPVSLERKTLWLAPERVADGGAAIVELMDGYRRRLLEVEPTNGDVNYNVIAVVFTDLPADRAQDVFADVFQQLAVPSYVEDGVLFGPYYEGNEATAIYNPSFRPFESPVPFLFVRHGVVADWKFFLDDAAWLKLWAQRYGASGSEALAEELCGLPWRTPRE